MLVAVTAYGALGSVINEVFAEDLAVASQACQTEQKICALPISYLGIAMIATLLVSLLSSLLAAWKATQIDPAEALREE